MKTIHGKFILDTYYTAALCISLSVAVLIHFPELVSLFDTFEEHNLFPGMTTIDVVNEVVFTFLSLIFLFAINTWLFHFNRTNIRLSWQKIIVSFVLTWILSNLLGQCFVYFHKTFNIPAIDAMVHHYLHPLRDFIMSCLVTSSCCIVYLIRKQQQVTLVNQELQAENIRNQYEALKNQLNPHMLFNSLNTLRSLVRESPDKAQEYIQELSRVLRYTLQDNEVKPTTLHNEMDFVSAYIYLLKMRYEDNLVFDMRVSEELANCYLPPMSVQVLVENAVKHNEISSRRPLTISIYTAKDNMLVVSNPLQPKITPTAGTGIGLANLAKRYQLLFKKDIYIEEDGDFKVSIPLIREYS